MKGEKAKLFKYYQGKKITITLVNVIDKRMNKFLSNKWNYHPTVSEYPWLLENYIPDRKMIQLLGSRAWLGLSIEEKIEVKAIFMVRQATWKRFHIWNKQFVPRWRVKYAPDTDFKIEIVQK